jgi:hypothetical protein
MHKLSIIVALSFACIISGAFLALLFLLCSMLCDIRVQWTLVSNFQQVVTDVSMKRHVSCVTGGGKRRRMQVMRFLIHSSHPVELSQLQDRLHLGMCEENNILYNIK